MTCKKFWEHKIYPDSQLHSRNEARQFFSQVLMAPPCVLLMSTLHTHITKAVRLVPARTWHIWLQKSTLGTDTHRNCYFALVHTQRDDILTLRSLSQKWWVMEKFFHLIWIRWRKAYKDHPFFYREETDADHLYHTLSVLIISLILKVLIMNHLSFLSFLCVYISYLPCLCFFSFLFLWCAVVVIGQLAVDSDS